MAFVSKDQASGCWNWTGNSDKLGYGLFWSGGGDGRTVQASRAAYEIFIRPPGDLFVLHKCDNPSCVNPDHLFLGTQLDNVRDMLAKGRGRQGYFGTPLTKQQIEQIRNSRESYRAIASRFHIGVARAKKLRKLKRCLVEY